MRGRSGFFAWLLVLLSLGTVAPGWAQQGARGVDIIPIERPAGAALPMVRCLDDGRSEQIGTRVRWQCSEVVVVAGRGVFLLYEENGQLKRQECTQMSGPCKTSRTAKPLTGLLGGGLAEIQGGKRMDKDVQIPLGLPVGRIYNLTRAGTFDFTSAGTGSWSVVISQAPGRTPLIQRSGSERLFVVQPGVLQRGGKYSWTVMIGTIRYSGGFDVLDVRAATEVEDDFREQGIDKVGIDRAQMLDEMLILFEHGLDYEAKLLARELGL